MPPPSSQMPPSTPAPTKQGKQGNTSSTQSSLLVTEIKDGTVVMRDGTLRAVILGSAINFDLMSRGEQDSVEYAYQGFLNSLHFPIQILIKSQKIDLDGYIAKLSELRRSQDNELLGVLMEDYIANIQSLVDEVNIMDKQFYIIVPFFPPVNLKSGFFDNLTGLFKPIETITVSEQDYAAYKAELAQRVSLVASGLAQMGVRAVPLNTAELDDLFYTCYNPDVAANQKMIDAAQLQTAVVTKGEGNVPKTTLPGNGI